MNHKINMHEPICGFNSIFRKLNKKDEDAVDCLDIMHCINLEKFGNDNLNFAAILINGHHNKNIVDDLLTKIRTEFNSVNFSKLSNPTDFMDYIKDIFQRFEQKFLTTMANLFKKKLEMLRKCNILKSDVEESEIMMRVDKIENELKSGATIAIAALIRGNIYIFNIGDNQIILVAKDGDSSDIDALQFLLQTEEDSFHNEKEINRIKDDCGLNPDALRWLSMLSQERCHSRCIGDYEMKKLYKDFDSLTAAISSPLICTPQSNKCIPFENNFTHILLVSSGLFYLVRELIYDSDKVPGEISRKFFEIKAENGQDSLNQLCKKVLEFFVEEQKKYHAQYRNLMGEDCIFMEYSQHDDLSLFVIDISTHLSDSHVTKEDSNGFEIIEPIPSNVPSATDSLDSINARELFPSLKSGANYAITPITAYVDFTQWHEAMNKMSHFEMSKLDLITNIDESFAPPIAEESESMLTSRSTTIDENKSPELSSFPSPSLDFHAIYNNSEAN